MLETQRLFIDRQTKIINKNQLVKIIFIVWHSGCFIEVVLTTSSRGDKSWHYVNVQYTVKAVSVSQRLHKTWCLH